MPTVKHRPYLTISISGGRSSAMAAYLVLNNPNLYQFDNIKLVFANTGLESVKTLEFLQKFEKLVNKPITKLEFISRGKDYHYNIIDKWEDLNMNGAPFEQAIIHANRFKNVGLPHMGTPYCSSLMKKKIIRKYSRTSFGTIAYTQCIGFRAEDMPNRITFAEIKELGNAYIFPLLTQFKQPIGLKELAEFWRQMPFQLGIDSTLGNCLLCWKKSDKTLQKSIHSNLDNLNANIDFYKRLEAKHKNTSFRGRRSIADILNMARNNGKQMTLEDIACSCGVDLFE